MAATLTSAACLIFAVGVAIVGGKGLPATALWGGLVIFTLLSGVCGWMLIRLLRNVRANNGKTTMPEWFIQVFGVVFLVGICIIAIADGIPWFFTEALGVVIAMIGIHRLVRVPTADDCKDENKEGKEGNEGDRIPQA